MDLQTQQIIFILGIPFLALVVCWISLMWAMKETTGELKHWLTPDNVIKGIAVIFIISAILVLAVLKVLDGDLIATILSGIIGYTLGTSFIKND